MPRNHVKAKYAQLICEHCERLFSVRAWRRNPRFCSRGCAHDAGSGRQPIPIAERFWPRVDKAVGQGPDGTCWEWTASRNGDGYGFSNHTMAHRVSWEIHNGSIPNGLCVLHRCDNPPCVNPAHLFLGTKKDNAADMSAKGRCYRQRMYRSVTPQVAADIVRLRKRGLSYRAIERLVRVGKDRVREIVLSYS